MALENAFFSLMEAAELEGISYETMRKNAQRNKIRTIKVQTNERKGFEYRIMLDDLTEKAKRRYYARLKSTNETDFEPEQEAEEKYQISVEELTSRQREEAVYWVKVLNDWREYVGQFPGRMTEKTTDFIRLHNVANPDREITASTLRLKWKLYREHGEIALADHRANRKDKGRTSISEIAWSVFLQWWLDENRPSVSHVYKVTTVWAEMRMAELLPLPSEDTFRRAIAKIPVPVVKYFRDGKKEFEDRCLAYLQRTYDLIDSNDIWSSDYHTLDMMVRDDVTGKVFRPHAVVWIDVRSRKMLSMKLCESSNSDGVILAFRNAVRGFGSPNEVYLDNGREFLVSDFGGRGRRKTDDNSMYGATILERMGIKMTNARVKNAKAKVIERAFKQVTEEFAKMYMTYCGNRPENRPERHNSVMRDIENIPLLSEVEQGLMTYIEGWYNTRESKAEGLNGKTPNQVYAENLVVKRTATEEQLNLLLARSSKLQSVERNGVYLKFGEKKIFFYSEELVQNHFKQKVYVRYDSEDLSVVRICDEDERLIGPAYKLEVGGYAKANDTESIQAINSKNKKLKRFVKEFKENQEDILEAPEMREILFEKARRNIEEQESIEAKILEPFRFMNQEHKKAAGADDDLIDMSKMIQNAKKNKREENK